MGRSQIRTICLTFVLYVLVSLPLHADQDGLPYWQQNEQGKYRLMSSAHIPLTDYRYDSVYDFHHDVAIVMIGNGVGLVNSTGKEIAKPIYTFTPIHFGEVPIIPSFRGETRWISFLYYVTLGGATWLDANGKILQTGTKMIFTVKDQVPETLWDY